MRAFDGVSQLRGAVGAELGTSDWSLIDQDRIDRFADLTGDYQWIHVDQKRAAQGSYGTTIAHGYLSVSLLPGLAAQIYRIDGVTMTVNYGLNRVRFPAIVPVGSRVRSSVKLDNLTEVAQGVQLLLTHTLHLDGGSRPAVVAEQIRLVVP